MKANSTRICGRKMITPPRPAMMPSTIRLASGPSPMRAPTHWPSATVPASIRSITGVAQAYTAWKIRNITTARVSRPNSGCSSQRSSASSILAVRVGMATAAASRRRVSACRVASRPWVPASGSCRVGGCRCAASWSMPATSARAPCRRTATVSTTGTPSSRSSAWRSMSMPRRAAASDMFRATIIGVPICRTSSTKRRCRRRLVASTTHTTTSGAASPG